MSIATVRPVWANSWGGTWYNDGSYGPGPDASRVNDANDDTTMYGVSANTWADWELGDYSLASNERCAGARWGVRLTSFNNVDSFNADVWLKPGIVGDTQIQNITGPFGGFTTLYSGWDVREYIQSAINGIRVAYRENHSGVTVAKWADVWVDLDIRHEPWATNVQPTGTITTRTPTLSWNFNDSDGAGEVAWEGKIYAPWTSDPANTANPAYASGQVGNNATSVAVPALGNGTYYTYVRVAKDFWGWWWSSGWAGDTFTVNAPPAVPANLVRTGSVTDATPNFSADLTGYAGIQVQTKVRFELYQNDGVTLIGAIDSSYITGAGTVSAEYGTTLALGTYKVRAQAIETGGQSSAWTSLVTFQVNVGVTKDLGLVWNVASPTVAVFKDLNLKWNVVELKAKQLTLLWTVYAAVTKDLTLNWNVATAWGEVSETENTIWTEVPEG